MPTTLLDPVKGTSYKVEETAFQDAVGTTKARWEWLEEKISPDEILNKGVGYPGMPSATKENVNGSATKKHMNGSATKGDVNGSMTEKTVGRPELEIFGLAMLGVVESLELLIHMVRMCQAKADPFSGPHHQSHVN